MSFLDTTRAGFDLLNSQRPSKACSATLQGFAGPTEELDAEIIPTIHNTMQPVSNVSYKRSSIAYHRGEKDLSCKRTFHKDMLSSLTCIMTECTGGIKSNTFLTKIEFCGQNVFSKPPNKILDSRMERALPNEFPKGLMRGQEGLGFMEFFWFKLRW